MSDKDLLSQFNDNNKKAKKPWSKHNVITPHPNSRNGIPTLISSDGTYSPAIDPSSLSQGNDYASTTAATSLVGESLEGNDYKELLNLVVDHFGTTDTPKFGSTFILPNGLFLDIFKYGLGHSVVDEYLNNIGKLPYEFKLGVGSEVMSSLGCIRTDGRKQYIDLPRYNLSSEQYNTLLVWIDYLTDMIDYILVETSTGDYKEYDFKKYTPDEIVDKIRRSYIRGKLVEGVTGIRFRRSAVGERWNKPDSNNPNKYNPNRGNRIKIMETSQNDITLDIMKNNYNYLRVHANDLFDNLKLNCEWDSDAELIHILVQFKDEVLDTYTESSDMYPYPLDIIIPNELPVVLTYNSKKSVTAPDFSTEVSTEDTPFYYSNWSEENDNKNLVIILVNELIGLDKALNKFNESLIESYNDPYVLVDHKEVPDAIGNKSTYEWYMDEDQNSVFILDGDINKEINDLDEAQSYWDSIVGFSNEVPEGFSVEESLLESVDNPLELLIEKLGTTYEFPNISISSYILPNGSLLKTWDVDLDGRHYTSLYHSELSWIANDTDLEVIDSFASESRWIKVDTRVGVHYLAVPDRQLNSSQYDMIDEVLDYTMRTNKEITLTSYDGKVTKTYPISSSICRYDILSSLSNYYRSGILESRDYRCTCTHKMICTDLYESNKVNVVSTFVCPHCNKMVVETYNKSKDTTKNYNESYAIINAVIPFGINK